MAIALPDRDAVWGLMIIEDHDLVRVGIRTLLRALDAAVRPEPVLEAGTFAEGLKLYEEHAARIHLVLLDLHLPDAHGLSALRELLHRHPGARVAVLSADSHPDLICQALNAGACDYLTKATSPALMVERMVALSPAGGCDFRPCVRERPAATGRQLHNAFGEALQLSERQSQLLDLIVAGCSNREIAGKLFLSEGTVKNHVSNLLLAFGVRSRAQLITLLR